MRKRLPLFRLGFFAKVAVITIIFFLVVSIVDYNIEINSLKKEYEKKEREEENYSRKVELLTSQLEEEVTEDTIKRIAKEKLNLREPGDQLYANDLPN